jgi:hypothetical protein
LLATDGRLAGHEGPEFLGGFLLGQLH